MADKTDKQYADEAIYRIALLNSQLMAEVVALENANFEEAKRVYAIHGMDMQSDEVKALKQREHDAHHARSHFAAAFTHLRRGVNPSGGGL